MLLLLDCDTMLIKLKVLIRAIMVKRNATELSLRTYRHCLCWSIENG